MSHKIIKNVLSKEICNFLLPYYVLKKNALLTYIDDHNISPFDKSHGTFGDKQSSNKSYCAYSDTAAETILALSQSKIEKELNKKLIPTYSYMRLYEKGEVLEKHQDRFSCELSGTIFIGGEKWPIYLEVDGETIEINLEQGDMLIYEGAKYSHWRDELKQNTCTQIFVHYIYDDNPDKDKLKFDGRKTLGAFRFGFV